ncbi:MAG: metallophosphoesterase family protein [Rhodospirillales bacterium]|nr:MAG: metallophosphoesterase family protein [Rhodospirillales bacterium]
MRIAAISDIHGNRLALEAVLDDILRRGVDATVNLGDILSGPLDPVGTAGILIPLDLPTIRGNHERHVLDDPAARLGRTDAFTRGALGDRERGWLRALPETLRPSDAVFMCHGTPGSDLVYFMEDVDGATTRRATLDTVTQRAGDCRAEVILCGHTHVPRSLRLADGRLVVNPGSVGLQAYTDVEPNPHAVEIGSPHARYAVIEKRRHGWRVEHVELDYDWHAAARQAAANGRDDWARWLATGWN